LKMFFQFHQNEFPALGSAFDMFVVHASSQRRRSCKYALFPSPHKSSSISQRTSDRVSREIS
jgi:hypothetical protein